MIEQTIEVNNDTARGVARLMELRIIELDNLIKAKYDELQKLTKVLEVLQNKVEKKDRPVPF